ncbi:MAG TPA: hypothetical protein VIV55_05110 [Flavobacterium sp.]
MIEQAVLIFNEKRIIISPLQENLFKTSFPIPVECQNSPFDIEITFQNNISAIRNNDYQWISADKNFIAANFVPKILKLSDGFFVQPNSMIGVWEYSKKYNNKIIWRLNHPDVAVVAKYQGASNKKNYCQTESQKITEPIALLFSKVGAVEFSRSKIPFSAVACFTDHCDFDTPENLKLQRNLLKETGVKVTKGFFLNHFSKRTDNASWQNDFDELKKWLNEGHELAYHSLSQSIKSDEESATDFRNFKQVENVVSWIDHGFQPYNFSLFENTKIVSPSDYFEKQEAENIKNHWNYIDSGTSTTGVLNQLNPNHFTLNKFWKGNKGMPFLNRIQAFIKNCFFHHYVDETLIDNYKAISQNIKDVFFSFKLREIPKLLKNGGKVLFPLLKVILSWNSSKNKPYRFAKYNSIVFRYRESRKKLMIFQTLEMLDFEKSLSPENIDVFIQEKGLFIAHTYFSVPLKYHLGRMFVTEDSINKKVADNFMYLGQKISNKEIWNPTLDELVLLLSNFEKVTLDVDTKGNIMIVNASELTHRMVS